MIACTYGLYTWIGYLTSTIVGLSNYVSLVRRSLISDKVSSAAASYLSSSEPHWKSESQFKLPHICCSANSKSLFDTIMQFLP